MQKCSTKDLIANSPVTVQIYNVDTGKVEERKMMIDPFLSPNGNYAGMKSLDSVSELIDANIYIFTSFIYF